MSRLVCSFAKKDCFVDNYSSCFMYQVFYEGFNVHLILSCDLEEEKAFCSIFLTEYIY